MASVVRGGVYWANLEPVRGHEQGGRRPVVVLSHTIFNERSGTAIAMAVTSQPQRAGYPLTWKRSAPLAGREAWVKISQVRILAVERLGDRIDQLSDDELGELTSGLWELIG